MVKYGSRGRCLILKALLRLFGRTPPTFSVQGGDLTGDLFAAQPDVARLQSRLGASVHIISDIDGTVSDEGLPEAERLNSVGPAREAFRYGKTFDVNCTLMSARTIPECALYRAALEIDGYIIGEDGGQEVTRAPPLRSGLDLFNRLKYAASQVGVCGRYEVVSTRATGTYYSFPLSLKSVEATDLRR